MIIERFVEALLKIEQHHVTNKDSVQVGLRSEPLAQPYHVTHLHVFTGELTSYQSKSNMSPDPDASSPPTVHGISVTPLTQCAHWHSPLDIIAIKHYCCQKYYACISCHDAGETHKSGVWPRSRRGDGAVLCGACKHVLSIEEYLNSGSRCTQCGKGFNPGCKNHWDLYFEVDEDSVSCGRS